MIKLKFHFGLAETILASNLLSMEKAGIPPKMVAAPA